MDILLVKGNHNIKLDLHQAKAITDILLNHFSRIYFQEPWPLVGGGDNPLFAGYQYTMYFVWSHYIKWAIFLSIKGFLVLECTSFDLCQWCFKVFIFFIQSTCTLALDLWSCVFQINKAHLPFRGGAVYKDCTSYKQTPLSGDIYYILMSRKAWLLDSWT